MKQKLSRILFSTLIFLLPINLGKHFISTDAYVRARLIDYLVPTIWLQDILILLLLILNPRFEKKWLRTALIFLAVFLPSILTGENLAASTYFYVRIALYTFFMLFIISNIKPERDFPRIIKLLGASALLLGVLTIFQWREQGSVFDNYLIFGEQPYNSATFNVARVDLFGRLKIPAYGTFRHPNTLGGFLAIVLFWLYSELRLGRKQKFLMASFLLGFIGLVLTFSQAAMAALFLSMIFFLAIKMFGKRGVLFSIFVTFVIFTLSLFLPVISTYGDLADDPSIYRRTNLLKSSYEMIAEQPLFGVGLNNFPISLQDHLPLTQVLAFNQPVHNIFALIASESGIFAVIAVIVLLCLAAATLLNYNFGYPAVLFITILQLIILGSLDHYIWTIHQTQILFWLTLGLALAYTNRDAQV